MKTVSPANRHKRRTSEATQISFSYLVPFILVTIFLDRVLYFLVDDYAIGFVRGALVQKVADRWKVVLKGDSLNILALGELGRGWGGITKTLMKQLSSPWTYLKEKFDLVSMGVEAGRTLAIGCLFDHHLSQTGQKTLSEKEAVKIRRAIEQSLVKSSWKIPASVFETIKEAGGKVSKGIGRKFLVEARRGRFSRGQALIDKIYTPLQQATEKVIPVLTQEGSHFIQQLEEHYDALYKKTR